MNNKAFTLVELITTFAVASAIALILFNVVISIKNVYSNTNLKTNLLINQGNLSNQINSKIMDEDIMAIDYCNESSGYYKCYKITFSNNETLNLVIKDKMISFGNYVYKLDDGSYIDLDNTGLYYKTYNDILDTKNSILNIKIPIRSKQIENIDFGLNFVYLYNNGEINFNGLPSNS